MKFPWEKSSPKWARCMLRNTHAPPQEGRVQTSGSSVACVISFGPFILILMYMSPDTRPVMLNISLDGRKLFNDSTKGLRMIKSLKSRY